MAKILIVDEYPSIRELLAEDLAAEGNVVVPLGKPELIKEVLFTFDPDLIILDLFVAGKMRWNLLKEVKKENPALPVLVFTNFYPEGDPRISQAEGWVIKNSLFDKLKQKIVAILEKPPSRENAIRRSFSGTSSRDHLNPDFNAAVAD
jgi:DNA-binding NtrC family response regulator